MRALRTGVEEVPSNSSRSLYCPVHRNESHNITECNLFAKFHKMKKNRIIMQNHLCFKCLGKHMVKDCSENVCCSICQLPHVTAMHIHRPNPTPDPPQNAVNSVAKTTRTQVDEDEVELCIFTRTFMVDVSHDDTNEIVRCVAIIDDQSTRSYAATEIMVSLGIVSPELHYSLTTLMGLKSNMEGNKVSGLKVRGVGEKKWYSLPCSLTNDFIPNNSNEIATPSIIRNLEHVRNLAGKFVEPDYSLDTLLLIGADAGALMETACYGKMSPFVIRSPLGYSLVGPIPRETLRELDCEPPYPRSAASVLRTDVLIEKYSGFNARESFPEKLPAQKDSNIFERRSDDEVMDISKADRDFLNKMSNGFEVSDTSRITLPLPFRDENLKLPNNSKAVFVRTSMTLDKLKKDSKKLEQCCASIQKGLDLNHIEVVPANEQSPLEDGKAWWLPLFAVYHPQKDSARLVFDASAKYKGAVLNEELLQGPNLTNDLRVVLLRFRQYQVAFCCDIKHMFNNFNVPERQRDFFRFYWFEANDPNRKLVQYRSRVHLFGARSSPSVASYGLRLIASRENECREISDDTADFMKTQFYVDDGVASRRSVGEAKTVLAETSAALAKYGLLLHKVVSNSSEVTRTLEQNDESSQPQEVALVAAHTQKALGVIWNRSSDELHVTVTMQEKPFTRRGVLSTINELFDPLGMAAPVVLGGRILQREMMKISDKLSDLNFNRYQDFTVPFNNQNAKPAIAVFNGDVYNNIDVDNYSESDLDFAQKSLRILSGLYGILKPLEDTPPFVYFFLCTTDPQKLLKTITGYSQKSFGHTVIDLMLIIAIIDYF